MKIFLVFLNIMYGYYLGMKRMLFKNKMAAFIMLFLFVHNNVVSQISRGIPGIEISPKYGVLLPHRSTMEHLYQGHSFFIEAGATFQMDGSAQWHKDFNHPTVSFLLNYMDFGNREVLGRAFGGQIATFLPYFRKNGWAFGSRIAAGFGYVTKTFDQAENPKNNAIGSHLNALATFGFKFEKQFKRSSLGIDVSMSHYSNGAFKLPNLGLNVPLLGFNYTHYLTPITYLEVENESLVISKKWDWFSQLIISSKQIYPTGGSNYGILALTNFVQYNKGVKCKIELGVDAIYNQSVIRDEPGEHGPGKNIQLGTYLAYVLPVYRIDFLVGMGRYVYNPLNPKGMWYHKLGSRIRLTDRLQANIVIKAHWAKADYFEYGLTYRW